MNDTQQQGTQHPKRPYQKPALIQVPLRPDEAVLGNCKTVRGTTAGVGNSNCRTPRLLRPGFLTELLPASEWRRTRWRDQVYPGGSLSLRIGDITVALLSGGPGLKLGVEASAQRFLVESGEADATVRAAWDDLREPATGDRIFDSGALWQLYHQDGNYIFRFTSPAIGALPYKEACFNADFTFGELSLHRAYFDGSGPAHPLEYPLDELWMVHLLAQGRGVEVHACGVQDSDGRGYLFLGHSGGGKSTMARLWQCDGGVQVLSDDRIILRFLDGRLWMYGTPWHGEAELAAPIRTGLTQIFFLGRGSRNEMIPLRQPDAVSRLLACSFVPFYSPSGLDFTLALLQKVTKAIPCTALQFVPDERAVEFVREQSK